ncbi:serine hydrolase domain-containing protein [Nocardioides sp.]|uniref:serine hydrolase domain-containing protein n=1 Tax=Nocardioides sp. TaxID=35761 RepID=UPI002D7ED041|nr:serine hydrolase domain-containing protein [Nocardioides sp.]HET8960133.1 serine hydrolase domain-containing protein [Nocardioides sp.]
MNPETWQGRLGALQSGGRLPSVVAGVLRGGDLAWTGAAGEGTGEPVDRQYRIGSITKTLVAVAVLRLRDAGVLGLDDPIGRFVADTGYASATVRALLSHTSGMQSEPVGPWWERSPGSDFETLVARNDGSGAVAGPGDFFHYSNLGFALLGEVVARAGGGTWWDLVAAEILDPLGMARTTYHPEPPYAQGFSVDHFAGTLTPEPHQDTGAMAPAGQAWSTVGDLARWAAFLAAGHPDVLDTATLREAGRPVAPAVDYGLGLRVLECDGWQLVGHTGSMPGFLASLFVDPETGDGTVALANATAGLDTPGVPAALLSHEPVAATDPWVPTDEVPRPVRELLGLWFWGNTATELRWSNGRLELRSLVRPDEAEQFELRGPRIVGTVGYHRGEELRVVRGRDGSVSHLDIATFIHTRTPYDPAAPIPGGHVV